MKEQQEQKRKIYERVQQEQKRKRKANSLSQGTVRDYWREFKNHIW